jgi:hypothetical protein
MSHDREYSSGHDDRDARRDGDDHVGRSVHSGADEGEVRAPAVRSMERPGRRGGGKRHEDTERENEIQRESQRER